MLTWTTGDRLLVTICAGCFLMRPSPPESDSDGILSELFVEPTERWLSATSHLLGVTHAFGGVQDATRTWRIDRIRSAPGKPQAGPLLHASPAARTPILRDHGLGSPVVSFERFVTVGLRKT